MIKWNYKVSISRPKFKSTYSVASSCMELLSRKYHKTALASLLHFESVINFCSTSFLIWKHNLDANIYISFMSPRVISDVTFLALRCSLCDLQNISQLILCLCLIALQHCQPRNDTTLSYVWNTLLRTLAMFGMCL